MCFGVCSRCWQAAIPYQPIQLSSGDPESHFIAHLQLLRHGSCSLNSVNRSMPRPPLPLAPEILTYAYSASCSGVGGGGAQRARHVLDENTLGSVLPEDTDVCWWKIPNQMFFSGGSRGALYLASVLHFLHISCYDCLILEKHVFLFSSLRR